MKSRYEIELGCDFARLDNEHRLAALRVFAQAFPLLMTALIELADNLHKDAASLDRLVKSDPDVVVVKAACSEFSGNAVEIAASFLDVFKLNAELLFKALHIAGVQHNTAAPSTTTKQ